MLAARTWVRVPPTTSGVFHLLQSFSTQQSNPNANIRAMRPFYLARGYQELQVKQAKKQKIVGGKILISLCAHSKG